MGDLVQLRRPASAASSTTTTAVVPRRLAYVETYGCQMNVADTEMVLGLLHAAGYARTDDAATADVILLNTCAVREKAEERVFARASMLATHTQRPRVVLPLTPSMPQPPTAALPQPPP